MPQYTTPLEFNPIDNSAFESLDIFIHESLEHFYGLNILEEDITIYMPDYFNRMLVKYNKGRLRYADKFDHMDTFRGIKVIDGYENKIIVAIKDGMLKPQEMPIP